MRRPPVAIGLPVYNGAASLEGAVRSLLAQTYGDFSLTISDNASTDDTMGIASRFVHEDQRVVYAREGSNLGAAHNFAEVLRVSHSPYFMWAAHDDFWEPGFLEELVGLLDANPDAAGAMCAVQREDVDEGSSRVQTFPAELEHPDPRVRARALRLDDSDAIYGLFRRDLLAELPFGDFFGCDNALLFGLALRGRIMLSERVLRTQRISGYKAILRDDGRLVSDRTLTATNLYNPYRPHTMTAAMLRQVIKQPWSWRSRARLSGHVVRVYWWNTLRQAFLLQCSDVMVRRAVQQRHYVRAGLLALEHVLLAPASVLRLTRRRVT